MPPFGLTAFQLTLPGWMVSSNCLFIQYLLLLLASLAFVIKLMCKKKKKKKKIYSNISLARTRARSTIQCTRGDREQLER